MDFPLLRVLFLPSLTLLLSKPVHVHCINATTPRTCRVYGSTVVLAEGDRFFVAQDNMCREFYCKDFFGELSPQEVNPPHTCVAEQSCDGNFTEFERNLSICCDHCSACDFRTCPDNSSCQDQGGFTYSCPCDSGFGKTMNGPCVDLCDKSLYTSYPNDSFAVVGQQLCVTCQHNSITHTEWWREGQPVACGSNNITCNSTAGTLCFNSISHNDLNRVYSCVHRKPDFTACAVNITIHQFDSPQVFNYMPGVNSIMFTWKPPTQPNGVITQYTLTVITVQQIQTVVLDGSTLSYLICNLLPLQKVRASISATTQEGEGPVVNIIGMTAAQVFSGVKQLRTVNSQSNILNISWASPSSPHGFIAQYSIAVENNKTEVTSAYQTHSRTTLTTYLSTCAVFGVPYYITVTPLDSCNTSGDPVSIVAFSRELRPLVAVMFTANRSANDTVITVSWQPVTLEQARGFFLYRVIISPVTSSKQQAAIMIDVPAHKQTSITVSNLDPSVDYTISVGVVNENNMELVGPTLPPLTIPSDSSSNGRSIGIVAGSILASCVLVGIAIIAAIIIIAVILKACLPNKKGGVTGINMTECAAYGMHQPHPSCDLHNLTGEHKKGVTGINMTEL